MKHLLKKNMIIAGVLILGLSNSVSVQAARDKDEFVDLIIEQIENNEAIEAEPMPEETDIDVDIELQDAAYPEGEILHGETVKLKGTISSGTALTSVTFKVMNRAQTKTYLSYTVKPNKTSYKISTAVNNKITIDSLTLGNYKYIITAKNDSGTEVTLLNNNFKVTGDKSTLSSDVKLSDTTIYKGNGSYVSGTVTSNYKINKVTVEIENTEYSITVTPNTKEYTISTAIDYAMRFDLLDEGTYTLKVSASDVSGKSVTQSIKVTVKIKKFNGILHDIEGVMQRTTSDCAFSSMATCELYNSRNGCGALGSALANAADPYKTLKARNGNSTYGNWSLIGYEKVYTSSLTTLFNALKNGPVIVHKTSAPGGHYSVVYAYEGSENNLTASNFWVYEVTNGVRMPLSTWLTASKNYSYNINGPGTLDAMVIMKTN